MKYFDESFYQFLRDLDENNNREWFHAHKKEYENSVKKPFEALVTDLILQSQKIDPEIQITAKQAMFRIHRDVRFSKDKTPYNKHVSANVARGGKRSNGLGFYLMINADKLMVGGGAYFLDKEQLFKVRNEIYYDGEEFRKIVDKPSFKKTYGELKGEKNKIIPKEFKEAFQEEPYIAHKQFYYMTEYNDPEIALSDNLDKFIIKHFKEGQPLNEFLIRALTDN